MTAGRPTKLTTELEKQLLQLIEEGLPWQICCDYVEIDYSTFWQWRKDNEKFSKAVKLANAKSLRKMQGDLQEGAPGWQSRAWLLERRHAHLYGKGRENGLNQVAEFAKLAAKRMPEKIQELQEIAQEVAELGDE